MKSGNEHNCGHNDYMHDRMMTTACVPEDKMVSSDSDYFSFTAQVNIILQVEKKNSYQIDLWYEISEIM